MMDLTTIARMNAVIAPAATLSGQPSQTLVSQLITSVSYLVQQYLDRQVQSGSQTQYFDVDDGDQVFQLNAYPVSAVASVYYDYQQAWATATLLQSTTYASPLYDPTGRMIFYSPFQPGRKLFNALKVSYTGGMAADTTSFVTAYPDVTQAVELQVAFLYQRRNDLGVQSISGDGGSVSMAPMELLPMVRTILDNHRRYGYS